MQPYQMEIGQASGFIEEIGKVVLAKAPGGCAGNRHHEVARILGCYPRRFLFLNFPASLARPGFLGAFSMHTANQIDTRSIAGDNQTNLQIDDFEQLATSNTPSPSPSPSSFFFDAPVEHPVIMVHADNDAEPIGASDPLPNPLNGLRQDMTADFCKFVVDRATKSAIEAVMSCARDNAPYWRMFFDQGLADAIAEETTFEMMFFEKLCGGVGLPYSADIIDGYLSTLPVHYLERFLTDSLKRKSHPAAKAFVGATYNTVEGKHFLRIVEVFFKYGLCVDPIGTRLNADLERAVCDGNEAFIASVIPHFTVIPMSLLGAIMNKASNPARIVNLLVEHCGVSLEAFSDPKVLAEAKPCARDYVIGLQNLRASREPEQIIERRDEDVLSEMAA